MAVGVALFIVGLIFGTVGILLCLTIVFLPIGLFLVLIGIGLGVPGLIMGGYRGK